MVSINYFTLKSLKLKGIFMESLVVDKRNLSKTVVAYIRSEKIKLVPKNGTIILSPVRDKYSVLEKSFGLFSDGKLSSKKFIEAKKREKELE